MAINMFRAHPQAGVAAAGGLMVLAAAALYWRSGPPAGSVQLMTKAYYSVDDGKTWFADDLGKACPFEHQGKQAVKAAVFKRADGTAYCGYLQRLTDGAAKQIRELQSKGPSPLLERQVMAIASGGTEVKRPGEPAWVPLQSRDGSLVITQSAGDEAVVP